MSQKRNPLRFLIGLGLAGSLLLSSALAAPPSAAFLNLPPVYRLLQRAGLTARELNELPELQRVLRNAEIDFLERARLGQALPDAARITVALERSGLDALLFAARPTARQAAPIVQLRPRSGLRSDPRGTLAELLQTYVWDGAINRPSDFVRQVERTTGRLDWTAREVVDEILIRRMQLVDELEDLAVRFAPTHPLLATEMRRASENIRVTDRTVSRIVGRHPEWAQEAFSPGRHNHFLGSYGAPVVGELGELLVLAREHQAIARAVPAPSMGRALCCGRTEQRVRAAIEAAAAAQPDLFNREVDILFDGLSAMGEVKTLREVLTLGQGSFDQVYAQARALRRLRDRLMQIPAVRSYTGRKGIQLRIYLNGGVEDEARRALEELGFQVFGPGQSTTHSPRWAS